MWDLKDFSPYWTSKTVTDASFPPSADIKHISYSAGTNSMFETSDSVTVVNNKLNDGSDTAIDSKFVTNTYLADTTPLTSMTADCRNFFD